MCTPKGLNETFQTTKHSELVCLFVFVFVLSQVPGDKVWKDGPGSTDPAADRLQRERPHVAHGDGAKEPDYVRVATPAGWYPLCLVNNQEKAFGLALFF